jgi:hypothetical protein
MTACETAKLRHEDVMYTHVIRIAARSEAQKRAGNKYTYMYYTDKYCITSQTN